MAKKLEWKKQIPNQVGYWLRLNAGHRVQLHHVYKTYRDRFGKKGEGLEMYWGWGGGMKSNRIDTIKDRLELFYWYGPLPEPPDIP